MTYSSRNMGSIIQNSVDFASFCPLKKQDGSAVQSIGCSSRSPRVWFPAPTSDSTRYNILFWHSGKPGTHMVNRRTWKQNFHVHKKNININPLYKSMSSLSPWHLLCSLLCLPCSSINLLPPLVSFPALHHGETPKCHFQHSGSP